MIRAAQVLLVVAAGLLWGASRLPWVSVRTFDELGPPKTAVLNGAAWSNALLPLALLLLAAALAALALRGWLLRAVAMLTAAACLAIGYLGISLIVMPDVGPRGAALADVPVAILVGSQRHLAGAVLTLAAAVCALLAAVLLMRAAATANHPAAKYAAPRASSGGHQPAVSSERVMWDALDAGHDPTERASGAATTDSGTPDAGSAAEGR